MFPIPTSIIGGSESGYDSDQPMLDQVPDQDVLVSATARITLKRSLSFSEEMDERIVRARIEGSDSPIPSTALSTFLEKSKGPSSQSDESSSSESVGNQPQDEQHVTIYSLRPDERNFICRHIDGVTAKKLRLVSKDWNKAVDSRGHIMFRRLRFDFDYDFGDKDGDETPIEYEALARFIRKTFYQSFEIFLKKLRNLKWVDLSKVDDTLHKIIPLIVNNNPSITHIDLGNYLCREDEVEKKISRADLMLIDEKCRDLTSLALSANSGNYKHYLINKPSTAFKNLNKLVLVGYYNKKTPLLFFQHLMFAYPNLTELVVVDCQNVDFSRTFDRNDTRSFMHLTHLTLADMDITNPDETTNQELTAFLQSIYELCPNLSHLTFGSVDFNYDQLVTLVSSIPRRMTINLRIQRYGVSTETITNLRNIVRNHPEEITINQLEGLPLPGSYYT